MESAITRRSADELKSEKGGTVVALVKATEVMIENDSFLTAQPQFSTWLLAAPNEPFSFHPG